jgi:hypothetical protein
VIDRELARLKVDIACLQETRLADSGSIKENSYTFFWQGKSSEEPRIHGVGFAVKNSLVGLIDLPPTGTDRILVLRLTTSSGTANIISAYAPTLCSTPEEKDQFYDRLDRVVSGIPRAENLYLLGDFNARVGADYESWPTCLGIHGIGKINENGQRLLEFCCLHELCVTNTYFNCKKIHRVSWKHPRSHHWHQLDLVITRRADLATVLLTRSYHSADCNTDHALVASRVRIAPKKQHHTKNEGRWRINTCSVRNPENAQRFFNKLQDALVHSTSADGSIESKWSLLRNAVYHSAIAAYGKKEKKNADWFEAHWDELKPLIETKRTAMLAYKRDPNPSTLEALKSAKRRAQQAARHCANAYWLSLCASMQEAADTGNIRGLYEGIKKATGPTVVKSAPLKSKTGEIITDRGKQLERWVEHYVDLYATQNVVTDNALDIISELPVMNELDEQPNIGELERAIDRLVCGKAPGPDGIPPEILKYGKVALLNHLYELLCLCWEQGYVPQDLRDARIVTLYKRKGDRSDCNNYRGISLLNVIGKVFARVALERLQTLASRVYPESQHGFRSGRSTTDMIFSLRQLQEKCREQRTPLYVAFIDLTKAFDMVSRSGLFKLLQKIGCPPHLLAIIKAFHLNTHSTISFNGATSRSFPVQSGVKQGCVLAPTLFGIFFSMLLQYAFKDCRQGVFIHSRTDGSLFNIARLRAKNKVRKVLIREMLFADDAALVSHSEDGLQQLVTRLSNACQEFGLAISLDKTKVMAHNVDNAPAISINGHNLENVDEFTYLGSTVSSTLSLEAEVNKRIGKAVGVMARLNQRVWRNPCLTTKTKLRVYRACVLGTLLYGSETWTTYANQEKKLNSFHLRCLRRILRIQRHDNIPNTEVLDRANMPSMMGILHERRLRWLGHVRRMDPGRIPKDLLYGEISVGTRPTGRPQLRYVDLCKRDLKCCDINLRTWETCAADRPTWRQAVRLGVQNTESERLSSLREKRQRKKDRLLQPRQASSFTCTFCGRDCHSRIGLHSHSRKCG